MWIVRAQFSFLVGNISVVPQNLLLLACCIVEIFQCTCCLLGSLAAIRVDDALLFMNCMVMKEYPYFC